MTSRTCCPAAWPPCAPHAARCVGTARGTAISTGLALLGTEPADTWIANTDADSTVPPGWLLHQLELAGAGAELVLGTAQPDPEHTDPALLAAWFAEHQLDERHPHVFGATLWLRADVWAAVGGFGPRSLHEDVALVQRVRSRFRVGTSDVHRVRTSSRLTNRVAGGLGGYLATLTPAAALP